MSDAEISKQREKIGQTLQLAVYEEILKKSKLGQYAIVERDGKTCRIPAKELIKTMKQPGKISQ